MLDALRETEAYENTIVIFSSDHGDMQGAHGGMHEKWHVAYEEALHVPFIVSSPLLPGGARELDIPTNHADLIPTLLGLTGIDPDEALARVQADHTRRPPARRARPLSGDPRRRAGRAHRADPLHHRRRDQRGQRDDAPARSGASPRRLQRYSTVKQPNHLQTVIAEVDVDGEQHLVKFSRYYDNAQFWTVPGERDERLQGRQTVTVTEPEPDEYELYDLTLDPIEERNLAHPSHADDAPRALQEHDARAPGRAARGQAPDPVGRRGPRLPPAGGVRDISQDLTCSSPDAACARRRAAGVESSSAGGDALGTRAPASRAQRRGWGATCPAPFVLTEDEQAVDDVEAQEEQAQRPPRVVPPIDSSAPIAPRLAPMIPMTRP